MTSSLDAGVFNCMGSFDCMDMGQPSYNNPCVIGTCSGTTGGTCIFSYATSGTACTNGGTKCNAVGQCK